MPLHKHFVYRSRWQPLKNLSLWRNAKLSRYWGLVHQVLRESDRLSNTSEEELRQSLQGYRQKVLHGTPTDAVLVPVFAIVREMATRVLEMRPYPVQVLAGIAIHHGHIIEMSTGEGKTLAGTMPAVLNALTDRGVHVVTVNDYLAKRDAEEMGKLYNALGLSTGCVVHQSSPQQRVQAYRCAITYITNKELGFDYLRDQLRRKGNRWFEFGKQVADLAIQQVQRPDFHFAIIDEADSILIDEARTPLIISNEPPVDPEVAHVYRMADKVATSLIEDVDYTFDRKERKVEWLKRGEQQVTRLLGGQRSLRGHRVDWHESSMRALKAHLLFHRNVEYVVENNEVIIVDESTGRKMPGRQWEGGLHQAVACKEGLEIKGETETLARVTYQILFNLYEKLSGMTGTIMTDANEVAEVYARPALRIPTNKPCIRKQYPDLIYATEAEKWDAVVLQIADMVNRGRPVLVGTRSIDKSILLSEKLTAAGIEHVVLNAHQEENEAEIVKLAGQTARVTVATNMAGRGTDIKLGPGVTEAGGLHVIGTERHESRRIDNQLIGRAGRQGDPGSAQFIISLEDPLMKRYRKKKSLKLAQRYGGRNVPVEQLGIRWFFRRVQLSIERHNRKLRMELIANDKKRTEYNRQLGTE